MAIGLSSYRFRTGIRRQNLEHLLPFKNWTYPYGPLISIVLNGVLILVQGWRSFSPTFQPVDFVSFYVQFPVMLVMFLGWKVAKHTKFVRYEEMDFVTDRYRLGDANGERGGPVIGQDGSVVIPGKKPFGKRGWREQIKTVGQWLFL
jgi:AAT family amino acid transporter